MLMGIQQLVCFVWTCALDFLTVHRIAISTAFGGMVVKFTGLVSKPWVQVPPDKFCRFGGPRHIVLHYVFFDLYCTCLFHFYNFLHIYIYIHIYIYLFYLFTYIYIYIFIYIYIYIVLFLWFKHRIRPLFCAISF